MGIEFNIILAYLESSQIRQLNLVQLVRAQGFECDKIRMSVWIETFKIVRFEIKIIFCEIKKILK